MAMKTSNMRRITSFNIQRRFSLILAASLIIILSLSVVGLYHLYGQYIIDHAESDAVSISQSFLAINHTLLLPPLDEDRILSENNSVRNQKLDAAFRLFLTPFSVIKPKVFSTDGTIIFSSDPTLIGQRDRNNKHLAKALSGFTSSKMQTKNEMMDLTLEPLFDVDVVETYVPICDLTGEIIGSFEIYQDTTRFRYYIDRGVLLAVSVLTCILLVVYFIAIKVIQISTKELTLAQNELERLASIDSLTSIYNRYYIYRQLNIEVDRTLREKGELSTILVDLDWFKSINDRYGHQVGDDVLKKVAKTIQENIRQYDCVGRYGGEEFLVVLPNAGGDMAVDIAERIRRAIENISIECDKKVIQISISAGVSTLRYSETKVDELVKRADTALYAAKSNGRNQVVAASQLVPEEKLSLNYP